MLLGLKQLLAGNFPGTSIYRHLKHLLCLFEKLIDLYW